MALLARTSHILLYAPSDSLACRLVVFSNYLESYSSYFESQRRWLCSLALVTYFCMLLATLLLAA
ncbi:hypothetical protein DYB39_13075 [Providencia rettgeri]|nr:hypothetical protein AM461_04690 [Providencia rettgeri]RFT10394.1 hypothetical protein DYB39_13075 [Providencia rettgeri]